MQTMMSRTGIGLLLAAQVMAASCAGGNAKLEGGNATAEATRAAPSGSGAAAPTADDARTVLVQMTSTGFSPNVLVLEYPPGSPVKVRVENSDAAPHGLRIRLGKEEVGLPAPIGPGESASFSFTMPKDAAQGEFFSPVANDRERGFRGRAVPVLEAPGG